MDWRLWWLNTALIDLSAAPAIVAASFAVGGGSGGGSTPSAARPRAAQAL